ncbi:MAG TPA: polymer-forming cytoskeletal protein [candidate division Zixibacteria bacterium]|nr:polymer-forming cytoskeletal protein [candidate division Zixibacteria bacterium]
MIKKGSNGEGGGLTNTIIGRDTVITGTLEIKGALRVDGEVKGKINCNDCVTIGTTGRVEAQIEAESAIIAGKMIGDVVTSEKIELQANCEMDGDLRTKSLIIEEGAVFCGGCSMKDAAPNLGFLTPEPMMEEEPASTEED